MFYFLLAPIMTYNYILVLAAVIPAAALLIKVYRSDRLEKESPALLWKLVKAGVLSSLLALVLERIGGLLISGIAKSNETLYNVLLYFVVVACSEEGAKFFLLYRRTWRSSEFNCRYDAVVYAVFVSLGFAIWENISYVLQYGFSTALVRALTAIPGHAAFGVFMGVFYGKARETVNFRQGSGKAYLVLSVLVPVLLHGAYDYIASMENVGSGWYFLAFIAVLFLAAFLTVSRSAKDDHYIA